MNICLMCAGLFLPRHSNVFMNQRDVVEVAKFVQWLQLAVWDLMEVPTNN